MRVKPKPDIDQPWRRSLASIPSSCPQAWGLPLQTTSRALLAKRNGHSHGGLRCCMEDSNSTQTEARWNCDHHWSQYGDGWVHKYQLHYVGCGQPGQDLVFVVPLLPERPRFDLCSGQQWQGACERGWWRAREDTSWRRVPGCSSLGVCQPVGPSWCHECGQNHLAFLLKKRESVHWPYWEGIWLEGHLASESH